jgi:hypothetical protein
MDRAKKTAGAFAKKTFSQEKRMKTTLILLNNSALLTCGAPCWFFTLPVPLLGFPVKQDDKKVNRIQKKSNRAAKNLTGEQKILQDGIKMVLDGKKGYR